MSVVVDDHLLLALLAGTAPAVVVDAAETGQLYTTGSWYYRLASAVVRAEGGSLSRRVAELPLSKQVQLRGLLQDLPTGIGLLDLRSVVPLMASFQARRHLNYLNAEVLAVALLTSAEVLVTIGSHLLAAAAVDLDVDYRVLR